MQAAAKVLELEKSSLQTAHAATKKEAETLKAKVTNMEPLYDVGVEARKGFLEMTKRAWSKKDNCFMNVSDTPPDVTIINARIDAVHLGNYSADTALIATAEPYAQRNADYYLEVYGIPKDCTNVCRKLHIIMNMHATMKACYSGTVYTHSIDDDRDFNNLQRECWSIWNYYCQDFEAAALRTNFGKNKVIDEKIGQMKKIVDKFGKLEKQRQRS